MNWKRIWSGAAIAGAVILGVQVIWVLIQAGSLASITPLFWLFSTADALIEGFFCSTLYAIARPRLGPGPKTAVIAGTSIFLIKYGLTFFWTLATSSDHLAALLITPVTWLKFVAATYLAGWQYIEKAP